MYKESYIEALLRDGMREIGGKAYKFESPGCIGVPDRIVIFPDGTLEFVELKSRMGKLRPAQKSRIGELQNLGQTVHVVQGIAGLMAFFEDHGYHGIAKSLEKRQAKDRE